MNINLDIQPNSKAGKGCGTLVFGVFAAMGLLFTVLEGKAALDTVRPYFWSKTDCVIQSSSVSEKGDGFELNVNYAYRFNGRSHTGTRFRTGMASSMDGEKAQRAALRYPPGSGAACYVNPSAPAESTLERGSLWMLLFILLPLVFVAVGVGGIIGTWRTKPHTETPVSERHRKGRGPAIALRLFGLVFTCAGGGMLYEMVIHPTMRESAAAKWPQIPCEILSSNVRSHPGDDSTTYSLDIRYRYTVSGHNYTGTRYNFDSGSSSSRKWRAEIAANYRAGMKTLCHVNPADPVEAVLSVKPSQDRWFGLMSLPFLLIGLFVFFKAPGLSNQGTLPPGTTHQGLPLLPRDTGSGEVILKPASSPMTGFIGTLAIALFWNGITWAMLLNMPRGDWFGRIFLGIFALIGAGLGVAVIYQFLALFNPRPILTASAGTVPLGGTFEVRWRFTGNVRRLVKFNIALEGREEATYRRGTTTTTDKSVFAILTLTDTADRDQIASGSAKITIPRELIHTFSAPNNKIAWTLRVAGDIPKWPDVSAEYPITVLPRETATLFQEEKA